MANLIYPKAKEAFLSGSIDLSSDTIKCILIDTDDYTYNAADDYLNDVPAGARVGTAQTLASKTVTNGVFDAADVTFSTVTGDQSEAVLIYKDTGVEATSNLIALLDTAQNGLPITPNGGDIDVAWDSGASKIFAL